MAYRLRYQCWVDWVPQGLGLGIEASGGPGPTPAGNAQTLAFFNGQSGATTVASPIAATASGLGLPPNSNTFLTTDVSNLLAAMASDLSAQMTASATLTRVQNFSTGTG